MLRRHYASQRFRKFFAFPILFEIAIGADEVDLVHLFRFLWKGNPNALVTKRDNGLSDLLARPNKFQSYFDFAETCMDSLELTGNLFIEKAEMDRQGKPKELYVLNPSRISIEPSKKDF